MTYRLLILACSQRKKAGAEYMPAIERYDGPLWQTLRTTELPDNLAVMFLSAKYWLGRESTPIDDYNARLTPETYERVSGGRHHGMPDFPGYCELTRHMRSSVIELRDAAEAVAERLGDDYRRLFEDVAIVGGHLYLRAMRREVVRASYTDGSWTVDPRARVTEINGSIGIMRRELRAWICDGTRALLEPMA